MATTWQVEVLVPGDGAADPYRYGWRYVRRMDEHGAEQWEQVPLTLLDVLHPQEDDFIVQSDAHQRRCRYLADVLDAHLAADPTAVVLHDVRVDWGVPGIRAHGPDIAVFFGVRQRKDWGTFSLAEEGVESAMVIEVTSPTTVVLDRATKVEQYERVGVPLYVLVDTIAGGQEAPPRLVGYRLAGGRYQTLAPDEHGRLWLAPVRLWLGTEDGEIVLYDEAGRPLGDYQALATELAAERQARAAAEQARAAAEDRAAAEAAARVEAEAHAGGLLI
jgi:Uma2 family endonuclease